MPPRRRKTVPDPPEAPPRYEPAPGLDVVWDGVEVTDAELPDTIADLDVRESRFVGTDLSGRTFTGLSLRDVTFERCDLSGSILDGAVCDRVTFTSCRLTGTVLSGTTLRDVRITECRADLANLRMARARFLLVEDTVLRGADLHAFAGTEVAILGCDLTGADLDRADLTGTRLHGSTLDDVRGALSLRGTRIGPDQQIAVGAALITALGIEVCD